MSSSPNEISVVTSTSTLTLSSSASFGDMSDLFYNEPIKSEGGTIHYVINTRRAFIPGNYKMNIVHHKIQYGYKSAVAILCLDHLNPLKIHERLAQSNMGQNFRCSNYINRYDWMHFRNWESGNEGFQKQGKAFLKFVENHFKVPPTPKAGQDNSEYEDEEDEECEEEEEKEIPWNIRNLVFFINITQMGIIKKAKIRIERENEWVHVILKEGDNPATPVGYVIVPNKENGLILGDWNYGAALVDKESGKCFAFIFEDEYSNSTHTSFREELEGKFDICKANYTFDTLADFE